jgi:hypothetical protein
MVTDSTAEEKKMPRIKAAPLPALLSARASSRARTVSTGTIIKVTLKVLTSAVAKTGSFASRA